MKICLSFCDTVFFYKETLESFAPKWWIKEEENYYPFYYSYDSEDVKRLKTEVLHVADEKIIHFVILGVDSVVEILTLDFPEIKTIKNKDRW